MAERRATKVLEIEISVSFIHPKFGHGTLDFTVGEGVLREQPEVVIQIIDEYLKGSEDRMLNFVGTEGKA